MSEPVAWQVEFENGEIELWSRADQPHIPAFGVTVTPLYASSYAHGVADAARVCERMTEKWVRRHSQGAMGQMCGLGEGTASECLEAIRAISPRPTVSEAWIERGAAAYSPFCTTAADAIRAAIQSLGYEVTK